MSRLATISTSCLLGLLCLGTSDASVPSNRVVEIEICKRGSPGTPPTCGPRKGYLPLTGDVNGRRPKINCPEENCGGLVGVGLMVRITAKPERGPDGNYRFVRWTGLCAGEPDICEKPVPARPGIVRTKAFFAPEG